MTIAAWLMALVGPLARQALISLGLGVVTYVGVDTAVSGALGQAQQAFAGAGGDVAAYLAMAGLGTALGIVSGGVSARVSMMVLKRMTPR